MSTRDRLTLAAALAVALACSGLSPLYSGTAWIAPVLGVVLLVAAAGAASRRAGLPVLAVPLVQLLALGGYAGVAFAAGTFRYALPTLSTVTALHRLLDTAAVDIAQLAVPVPSRPSLVLVAVLGTGAVAVLVDLLAAGLQRPALAGLPLLALLAVPSGLLPGGLGWLPFTLGAAGWLGLLLVEGSDRVGRWGVPLRSGPRTSEEFDPDAGSTGRVGRRIGAAALGLAAFLPALVPGLDARLLPGSGGSGPGDADGPRTVVTYNPITELQGDLTRPDPQLLLRYTTDDPTPDYLRMTTLDTFDGAQWTASTLQAEQPVSDGIPVPLGISSGTDVEPVRTRVDVVGLEAQWLPLPAVPTSVDVRGRWNWNSRSETVFSTRSSTTRAREYSAQSNRVVPDREALRAAVGLPKALSAYDDVPPVAREVRDLARQITRGTSNDYDAAVALQRWFRDPANGFEYEEKTQNPFDNPDALVTFLEQRKGFCEQYASAMAAMLRVLGIPARVGVGFTPGRPMSNGTYEVTTDDAHAWPEAFFAGTGWVRFEPTPVDDDREIVPTYTQDDTAAAGGGAPGTAASQAPAPADDGTVKKGKDLDLLDRGGETPLADPSVPVDDGSSLPSLRTVLLSLLVVLLVAPALVALLRRRLRWRRPGALTAWQQLRDDATDVGHGWDVAETPRAAVARLAAQHRLPAPAVE
ncbi:MAG: hypothetical protein JWN17_740, partial [Frankiales bacterium]|nr:hypothetical protein [Frankiales bacterium]